MKQMNTIKLMKETSKLMEYLKQYKSQDIVAILTLAKILADNRLNTHLMKKNIIKR